MLNVDLDQMWQEHQMKLSDKKYCIK
jgi:hypothetical protein